MNISWLTEEMPLLASYRYRVAMPAFILGGRHRVTLGETGDVVVCSKHFERAERAERLRALGKAIVFDCCDNHLGGEYRDHYLRMMRVAHLVTVPTRGMQELLATEGIESIVIPDPYEFPWREPRASGPKKLLWYGHQSNLGAFMRLGPRLEGYETRVLSGIEASWIVPWSLKAMMDGFEWCDAVIVPQDLDEKTRVKSPNRVVEAIWSGRFVSASPVPSYAQFAPFAHIGDVVEGLEWMRDNPEAALDRIKAGQEYIARVFDPVRIGNLWLDAFETALERR